jgi:hypothetical protein
MTTNELKKGARVILTNGWFAEIYDNLKGGTRLAKVYGFATEIGSVYAHDIEFYRVDAERSILGALHVGSGNGPEYEVGPDESFSGTYSEVQHTEKQIKHRATVSALGF